MRVVRQQQADPPLLKLKQFWRRTPLCTKIVLFLITLLALLNMVITQPGQASSLKIFEMRITEIVLLIIVGVTDLGREERKGSILFLLTLILKIFLLFLAQEALSSVFSKWPTFEVLINTSIPIQYLLVAMTEDALTDPDSLKYCIVQPFQVTSGFYPLLFLLLLLLGGVRVDPVVPLLLGALLWLCKARVGAGWLAVRMDDHMYGQRMSSWGLLRTQSQRQIKPLNDTTTNDSIVF